MSVGADDGNKKGKVEREVSSAGEELDDLLMAELAASDSDPEQEGSVKAHRAHIPDTPSDTPKGIKLANSVSEASSQHMKLDGQPIEARHRYGEANNVEMEDRGLEKCTQAKFPIADSILQNQHFGRQRPSEQEPIKTRARVDGSDLQRNSDKKAPAQMNASASKVVLPEGQRHPPADLKQQKRPAEKSSKLLPSLAAPVLVTKPSGVCRAAPLASEAAHRATPQGQRSSLLVSGDAGKSDGMPPQPWQDVVASRRRKNQRIYQEADILNPETPVYSAELDRDVRDLSRFAKTIMEGNHLLSGLTKQQHSWYMTNIGECLELPSSSIWQSPPHLIDCCEGSQLQAHLKDHRAS